MSTSLLGIAKEGEDFFVINITENYKARLVRWFGDLENRIAASLKAGNSVALVGPHGTGKSVLARYIAARFVGEYYAVIDLGVDVVTFDSLLEMLHEVPNALGFYDPLGISFYDNPLVPRGELATQWIHRCRYVVDRAMYLNTRDIPTLLVLPRDVLHFSPCRDLVEKSMRVLDIAEYLKHVELRRALEEVFLSHSSALGCRKADARPYVDYILRRHGDLSGVYALAAYGGRLYARQRCAPYQPEALYRKAIEELSKVYYGLYRELFFPTCREARALAVPLMLSLENEHLPVEVAYPLANVDHIARRLSILGKMGPAADALLREEILEELRDLYSPREEVIHAVRWSVAPKESVVREALKQAAGADPCMTPTGNPVQKLRTVYRGLLVLHPDLILQIARAIASIALGTGEHCRGEAGPYLCYNGATPRVVIEAIGTDPGRRITLELPAIQTVRCDDEDTDILAKLALTDARRVPAACLEKFVDLFYTHAPRRKDGVEIFYKLYRDYIEVAAERGTPHTLRKLAMAHLLGTPPRDSIPILARIVDTALEFGDYKTAEAAIAAAAALDPEAAARLVPNCDCPYLRISALYHVAKKMAEVGRSQEALNLLNLALDELERRDPRYEYTPQFTRQIELLYKQASLETLL
ncbi:hypothetical protein [Pyrobaculum ferrireducens]|uniref:Tetratricopeptide TPR_2 repeat protein n=1 Tax=Pyrobaculum ferrireducens TaxID=1104324 RepID=G7VEN5_9CREN|nr:hypothetical protein [Pyrobaculum ferrireducens]AET32851.1 Tetratricopeptide TPR_2 repeat protein [Pyrobaculum ferrireducens]